MVDRESSRNLPISTCFTITMPDKIAIWVGITSDLIFALPPHEWPHSCRTTQPRTSRLQHWNHVQQLLNGRSCTLEPGTWKISRSKLNPQAEDSEAAMGTRSGSNLKRSDFCSRYFCSHSLNVEGPNLGNISSYLGTPNVNTVVQCPLARTYL